MAIIMPRASKWAANTEMWQYAADLVRGGKTYSEVHAKLSLSEVKKRFGLLDIPHADTIRYQIKQRGLLEQKRKPSALYPEDLKTHERGLSYLAMLLRGQSSIPDAPDTGTGTDKHRPEEWTGFLPDTRNIFVPEESEEHEVYDQWISGIIDPRDLSHFEYLIEHLESSAKGKKIVHNIASLFEKAEEYSSASGRLWDVLHEDLVTEHQTESDNPALAARCGNIFDALHPTIQLPEGSRSLRLKISIKPSVRKTKLDDYGTPEVFSNHMDGAEHLALIKSWMNLDDAAENLKRIMTPSSVVRRLIQDGQCSICVFSNE